MKISANKQLIDTVKNYIRHPYEFGGYPKILIMRDGGCLCSKCTHENFTRLLEELRDESDLAWMPADVGIFWEGADFPCGNCRTPISSAYGDPEEEEE
ncbi:hypothetical protein VIK251_00227 [Klebsiella phage vB_KpnM_VIK251]|nr:hypothetical protein VIK251_00227 [Klebsiella phage vB_KpnM_VIK251]